VRRTKIVATIGPASADAATLDAMVAAGMDVARLNASHTSETELVDRLRSVRAAEERAGRPVAVMVDLEGPKVRIGALEAPFSVAAGAELTIAVADDEGSRAIPLTRPELAAALRPGDIVLVDDGRVRLVVESAGEEGVRTTVVVPGAIVSGMGVTAPGVSTGIGPVTEEDRAVLAVAGEAGADLFAQSLVGSAGDIAELRDALPDPSVPIVAKIERPDALSDIEAIVDAADAVMVARGDLGVEAPPSDVPVAQKRITHTARRHGVPVIVATEMLESMVGGLRPTRAEASDVANAVFDQVDAVMLSAETAIGAHPVESVEAMASLVLPAEDSGLICGGDGLPEPDGETVAHAVASAACELARRLDLAAIVTPTRSGATARAVAAYRPTTPIVAATPDPAVARRLALVRGVVPALARTSDGMDATVDAAMEAVGGVGLAGSGDLVAVTAGGGREGCASTDMVLVRRIP
jgi:pyruvate kinase